jgi:hypothetical protein
MGDVRPITGAGRSTGRRDMVLEIDTAGKRFLGVPEHLFIFPSAAGRITG